MVGQRGSVVFLLLASLLVSVARGATAEQLESRLQEIESLRDLRERDVEAPFDRSDRQKAASGSVVTQVVSASKGGIVHGIAVIDLPISRLWAGLNDETRHPGYSAVEYSELLKGRACQSGRHVFQYLPVPVPMVSDRWWIGILWSNPELYRASGGSVRELNWGSSTDPSEVDSQAARKLLDKAQPIGFTRGSWLLVALDERSTYVEYYQHSDPGRGIPSSLSMRLASGGLRDQFAAIERFTREGNPSCPIR